MVQKRHCQTAEYLHSLIQLLLILCEVLDQATESNGKTVTMEVTRLNIGRCPEFTGCCFPCFTQFHHANVYNTSFLPYSFRIIVRESLCRRRYKPAY